MLFQHLVVKGSMPQCSPIDMEFLPQKLKRVDYGAHIVGKYVNCKIYGVNWSHKIEVGMLL